MTPLHIAAQEDKLDIAQLLVQAGANIAVQNKVTGVTQNI